MTACKPDDTLCALGSNLAILRKSVGKCFFILLICISLVACVQVVPSTDQDDFGLTKSDRKALFEELTSEMERLDAQALAVRKTSEKALTWHDAVKSLLNEFVIAKNKSEYTNILNRLNLAYTNGHAELHLSEVFDGGPARKKRPAVLFQSFWIGENRFKNQIVWVDKKAFKEGDQIPVVGTEIKAINGRPLSSWLDENFNFCKYSLKNQCSAIFSDQFLGEKLSWHQPQELNYTLANGAAPITIKVPWTEEPYPFPPPKRERIPAEVKSKREYPGFKLVYTGENAFVYESLKSPKVAILRITSFGYWPTSPIRTPFEEVEKLSSWWRGNYHDLFIDLTENLGGNDPLPYFRILFDKPVHNVTRVRFKKIKEFTDPQFQQTLFWGDPQRMVFIEDLIKNHWDEYKEGSLLPVEPYVCGRPVGFDCDKKYAPYPHQFKGKISVLISKKCMSSCDEFVLTLKKYFGRRMRLIGQPQFSDTGFSRMRITVRKKPTDGHWTKTVPFDSVLSPEDLFHQEVVVTQSVDQDGKLIDGKPLRLDFFVPYTFENQSSWYKSALSAAQ